MAGFNKKTVSTNGNNAAIGIWLIVIREELAL